MVLTVLLALVTDRNPQGNPKDDKETDKGTDGKADAFLSVTRGS